MPRGDPCKGPFVNGEPGLASKIAFVRKLFSEQSKAA